MKFLSRYLNWRARWGFHCVSTCPYAVVHKQFSNPRLWPEYNIGSFLSIISISIVPSIECCFWSNLLFVSVDLWRHSLSIISCGIRVEHDIPGSIFKRCSISRLCYHITETWHQNYDSKLHRNSLTNCFRGIVYYLEFIELDWSQQIRSFLEKWGSRLHWRLYTVHSWLRKRRGFCRTGRKFWEKILFRKRVHETQ